MPLDRYVNTFNHYLQERFGERVARISFETGIPCPWGRCVFCDNTTFVPKNAIVPGRRGWQQRLIDQKKRMVGRYGAHKYLAYFQSGTSTSGNPDKLSRMYRSAARQEDVVGLIVSTRPDYVTEDIVRRIVDAAPTPEFDLWIEIGLQSAHERSLELLQRGHDVAAYDMAVEMIQRVGAGRIKVAVHLIAGIPGETTADVVETIRHATRNPVVRGVKIHHLQVYRRTPLADQYEVAPFELPDEDSYIVLLGEVVKVLPPHIVVMRFFTEGPASRIIAPQWYSNPQELLKKLEEHCKNNTITQGCGRSA
jgi:radical SAM protein (TIGR01212 family)